MIALIFLMNVCTWLCLILKHSSLYNVYKITLIGLCDTTHLCNLQLISHVAIWNIRSRPLRLSRTSHKLSLALRNPLGGAAVSSVDSFYSIISNYELMLYDSGFLYEVRFLSCTCPFVILNSYASRSQVTLGNHTPREISLVNVSIILRMLKY